MKWMSRTSLRFLLFMIFGLLVLPALLFSFVGFYRANAQANDLEQLRSEIDAINKEISYSIISPFYMSPRSYEPCNPATLELVTRGDSWQIQITSSFDKDIACEWVYSKNKAIVAVDGWKNFDRKLGWRDYYRNDFTQIGRDTFFVLDSQQKVKCVKERRYEEINFAECYAESGALISLDSIDNVFSPLPPMLYWFSYR
jgi:hypothetical protein